MLTFSVLMYLQSPYHISLFWDLYGQFNDLKKKSEPKIKKNKNLKKKKIINTATAITLMKNGELNTTRYLAVTRIIVQDWGVKSIYFLPSLPLVEKKKRNQKQKSPPQCEQLCGYARI